MKINEKIKDNEMIKLYQKHKSKVTEENVLKYGIENA